MVYLLDWSQLSVILYLLWHIFKVRIVAVVILHVLVLAVALLLPDDRVAVQLLQQQQPLADLHSALHSTVQYSAVQHSTVQFADLLRVVPVDGGLLLQRVADEHEVLQTLQL